MKWRFSLRTLLVGAGAAGMIVAAVIDANRYVDGALQLDTYLILAYATLEWAIRRQPWSVGFAIGGWSYVLTAQFWFGFPTLTVSEELFYSMFDRDTWRLNRSVVESFWTLGFATLGMFAGLHLHRLRNENPDET